MRPFSYARVDNPASAVAISATDAGSGFIAGGTDLLNLMKDGAQTPSTLVDLNGIGLDRVEQVEAGLRIGALSRMSAVASDPVVRRDYPVVSQALLSSASAQVRNAASIGGNLLQRTRCWYFRDAAMPCNTRAPGTGCPAINGENRMHAILGGSEACIKVHPSDLAVAMLALDASVFVTASGGDRRIPIDEFYLLPGSTPQRETVLEHAELITGVELPLAGFARRSRYVKVRDRASFEFALVSVAVALDIPNGGVRDARIALGGVAPRPWRARAAEDALRGQPVTATSVAAAAEAAVRGAVARRDNGFKLELVRRTVTRAITDIAGQR